MRDFTVCLYDFCSLTLLTVGWVTEEHPSCRSLAPAIPKVLHPKVE